MELSDLLSIANDEKKRNMVFNMLKNAPGLIKAFLPLIKSRFKEIIGDTKISAYIESKDDIIYIIIKFEAPNERIVDKISILNKYLNDVEIKTMMGSNIKIIIETLDKKRYLLEDYK